MYTEAEIEAVRGQQRRRWLAIGVPGAVLFAVIVWGALRRSYPVAAGATIALGILLIAGWDLFIKPLHCYEKMLQQVLHGIKHETACTFTSLSDSLSTVDGVVYRTMQVVCTDEDTGRPYDRMFYADAEKSWPDWAEGTPLCVTFHGKTIAAVREQNA